MSNDSTCAHACGAHAGTPRAARAHGCVRGAGARGLLPHSARASRHPQHRRTASTAPRAAAAPALRGGNDDARRDVIMRRHAVHMPTAPSAVHDTATRSTMCSPIHAGVVALGSESYLTHPSARIRKHIHANIQQQQQQQRGCAPGHVGLDVEHGRRVHEVNPRHVDAGCSAAPRCLRPPMHTT
jgi:hypothetical protein